MRARLRTQPWAFLYFAVGFGALSYVASGESAVRAVVGGISFAVLMSIWLAWRNRRGDR